MATLVAHSAPPMVQPNRSRPYHMAVGVHAVRELHVPHVHVRCRLVCSAQAADTGVSAGTIAGRSGEQVAALWALCTLHEPIATLCGSSKSQLAIQATSPTTVTVSLATPPVLVVTVDRHICEGAAARMGM